MSGVPAPAPNGGAETSVVVTQPVHQHAYEAAVAAQRAGMLNAFVTGLYDTARGLSDPRLLRLLPRRVRALAERRSHPELDRVRVRTISRYHAAAYVLRPLARPLGRAGIEPWAHERFDAAAARWLRHRNPTVVHAFETSALATFRAAREGGTATVLDVPIAREYAVRAALDEETHPPRFPVDRIRGERELADVLLAPSSFVEECLVEHGARAEKIVRLPYGADVRRFAPAPRKDGVFRALFVGAIGTRKGARYLLEAWARLDLPRAELVLVGAADADGRRILADHDGRYVWRGYTPRADLPALFAAADVFVFPTLAEGSALVSYEAMAAGLPLVTTPACGAVAEDGLHGFVVPTRNADALAEKLLRLYEEPELRREMGREARALVERWYTWDHYRERLARIYSALGRGEQPERRPLLREEPHAA